MRLVLFTHSLTSDWNHGNAHFFRGIVRELQRAGHETIVCEPADGWSRQQLMKEPDGAKALAQFADRLSRHFGHPLRRRSRSRSPAVRRRCGDRA